MKKAIEVKGLYKYYKVGNEIIKALDGIDFEIMEGEFCAIVGTSGSGKSTLLNMLAGLEPPTKGEIIINSIHIEGFSEGQLVDFRRKYVGFIFQSYQLIGTLTALENVALPLSFRGEGRKKRLEKANQMIQKVSLENHKDHMPNQMSGGQQQRVGVARALVMEPKIIFADEPTGNLDTRTSREIMKLMQETVRGSEKSMIMVTHDDELASYADRVIKIIDGHVVSITVKEKIEGN
ncbi:MAG: ABC transporter ATP-binding protein [Clostridia bacterium]|jgi:putative ABC transport system ATP-binding protein|nr:ABC transporter ATP-binding protein [Lachnospiraceae bacterium]NCC00924.1 ABC transporter ATP-binding protein [Clostridia bacterium]NCD02416.1 ABC transporter ATP-binding protein [Clostridia bacterium]